MTRFLNLIATEPAIAKVPIMIDSSKWDVIEAGLRCVQGKAVVNSISLKEGEDDFLAQGRALSAVRRRRRRDVLRRTRSGRHGRAQGRDRGALLPPAPGTAGSLRSDVIIDPNILAVATGIEEHNEFAKAFIEAAREIKRALPRREGVRRRVEPVFSFRGNEPVRRAMHSAFLYHAIAAGLDMAIVNAGQLDVYEDIPSRSSSSTSRT